MKRAFLVLAVAVEMICTVGGWAQNDAAGCKDSPILTRFPGSYIASCSKKDDDAADFPIANKPKLHLEGTLETIIYQFPRSASQTPGGPEPSTPRCATRDTPSTSTREMGAFSRRTWERLMCWSRSTGALTIQRQF